MRIKNLSVRIPCHILEENKGQKREKVDSDQNPGLRYWLHCSFFTNCIIKSSLLITLKNIILKSDTEIAALGFFWLVLVWYIFSHSFTFNLFLSPYSMWVSWFGLRVWSCFLHYLVWHFIHFTGSIWTLILNVIVDMVGFKSTIWLFVSNASIICFLFFLLVCLFLGMSIFYDLTLFLLSAN